MDEFNIHNIMKICSIKWAYYNNEFYYCLTDILTGKDIIISSEKNHEKEMQNSIYNTFVKCASNLNGYIKSMIIIGSFYEDDFDNTIIWDIDIPSIFSFMDCIGTVCYIDVDISQSKAKIRDCLTNKIISIINCSDDCAVDLNDFVSFMVTNDDTNYLSVGNNRAVFFGNYANETSDTIQYNDMDDELLFGDLDLIYTEFFKSIVSN